MAVISENTNLADNPVAGDDVGHRIGSYCIANCSRCSGLAKMSGNISI